MSDHVFQYLLETSNVVGKIDFAPIDSVIDRLVAVRARKGRVFVLGLGGSAGHASHMCCDLRNLCRIEAYAPTDNASEMTARINDEGWDGWMCEWLGASNLSDNDAVMILSVGGGSEHTSKPIACAALLAHTAGAAVLGIVGRDGGHTAKYATACVVIPPLYPDRVTPHTEGLAAVVWHCIVTDPRLQVKKAHWESKPQ